LEEKYILLLT